MVTLAKLELDAGLSLGAGGVLPVALRVQQQDGLAILQHVGRQDSLSQPCYDPHLLGRLGGVEVEVDDRGEQPRAEQQQQRLQQTSLQEAAQLCRRI